MILSSVLTVLSYILITGVIISLLVIMFALSMFFIEDITEWLVGNRMRADFAQATSFKKTLWVVAYVGSMFLFTPLIAGFLPVFLFRFLFWVLPTVQTSMEESGK